MPFVKSRFFIPFFLSFSFFLLYLHNLSNSVYGGDVGDLVTSAYVHGVPHAPGYPLFTLIGFLLTRVISWHSPAWRVGLISVFSGAFGIGFFYALLKRITQQTLVSFLTSLILGVSFFYWFYTEIAEVFALHILFTILLLYLAVLFRQTQKYFHGLLLFFVLGLACTNHQTIVLLVPSLFLIVFPVLKKIWKSNKRKFLLFFFVTCLGFIPYLYVPIASNTHPPLNWDNVHNLQSFLHLLLRVDYGTFRAGGFGSLSLLQRFVSVKVYGEYLFTQLTLPVCMLSLVGFWRLLKEKKQRVYFFALLLSFLLSGPFFIFYAGFPLTNSFTLGVYERFFLMSGVIFLIPFSFGLLFFTQQLGRLFPKRPYALLFQLVFVITPLALFFYNFPKTDLSITQLGDDYAKDILNTLPPHAFLIVSGDTLAFNTWYAHYALHVRPDVVVYNFGGGTSDIPLNKSRKGETSSDILIDAFQKINTFRPVYSTLTLQHKKGKQLTWVPYGFSYKLLEDDKQIPSLDVFKAQQQSLWTSMHIPTASEREEKVNHSLTIAQIPIAYSDALVSLGTFFYTQYKDKEDAILYYNKAIATAPDNAKAYLARGVYFLGEKNNCKEIASDLTKSMDLNPFQKETYFLLYTTYKDCGKNASLAKSVKKSFGQVFQQDFDKEVKKTFTNYTNIIK